ncbi:hypothetical protein Ac2012v2_001457 [Leucoagaricus gongylophorus]
MLSYQWDPDRMSPSTVSAGDRIYPASDQSSTSNSRNGNGHFSFDLGPHPADPHFTGFPGSPINISTSTSTMAAIPGPNFRKEDAYGQDIWVYIGSGGHVTLVSVFAPFN